ncbi:MAG: hypothetical protein Q9167_006785 [Letrouitia subvulpina]
MRTAIISLSALVAVSLALPSFNHVVHEKRDRLPLGWKQREKLQGSAVLPMRIALAQSNLEKAEEYLLEVSHPDSPNFGKHWTHEQIANKFAPSQESVDSVKQWLTSSGIASERISRSQSMGWLKFDATVEEVENLLKAEYFVYRHETGKPHVSCAKYHVPDNVTGHIDFIMPTVHFDVKIPQAVAKNVEKRAATTTAAVGVPVETHAALGIGDPTSGSLPKKGININIKGIIDELKNCNKRITPNCLRALYRFPPGVTANPKNSYGIVEYTPQAYLQSDLDLFFANFSKNQVQRTPTLASIDGGIPQTTNKGFAFNGESDLDLEYAMALINPQKTTLYQVGDQVEGASFNDFLDALDGSYCAGDDPFQDATYPDPFNVGDPGSYQGPKNCGGFSATKVISTSYGYNEADLTAAYEQRQCNEYMKLGLAGTSFLYSSGDYGVAGNRGRCIDPVTKEYNDGSSGIFNPGFPSTCPYVTAVGATQIKPGASVTEPEEACETVIYSGGGFSNVFPLPSYQASAVKSFFANNALPYGADRFNNSQQTRGFPDISANGANYVVAVVGNFSLVYGTSASSPVVGSILTLINEARFAAGKGSIGFINPTLYANPGTLNDITTGGNQGCGTPGFSAVAGWDPVTGLGTPNFPNLNLSRRFASEAVQTQPESEAKDDDSSIAASSEVQAAEEQTFDEPSIKRKDPGTIGEAASSAAKNTAESIKDTVIGAVTGSVPASEAKQSGAPEAASDEGNDTVYVGNLFFDVREEEIRKEFEKIGRVTSVKLIYDNRGLSKGFGYVSYNTTAEAAKAVEHFNMKTFEGRRMAVQPAFQKAPKRKESPSGPTRTLFIGNISFDMTDKELADLFRDVKGVVDVRVAIDRRTGQPRGFAHADFVDIETAKAGREYLFQKVVCGRPLRVDYSLSTSRRMNNWNNASEQGNPKEHTAGLEET